MALRDDQHWKIKKTGHPSLQRPATVGSFFPSLWTMSSQANAEAGKERKKERKRKKKGFLLLRFLPLCVQRKIPSLLATKSSVSLRPPPPLRIPFSERGRSRHFPEISPLFFQRRRRRRRGTQVGLPRCTARKEIHQGFPCQTDHFR